MRRKGTILFPKVAKAKQWMGNNAAIVLWNLIRKCQILFFSFDSNTKRQNPQWKSVVNRLLVGIKAKYWKESFLLRAMFVSLYGLLLWRELNLKHKAIYSGLPSTSSISASNLGFSCFQEGYSPPPEMTMKKSAVKSFVTSQWEDSWCGTVMVNC